MTDQLFIPKTIKIGYQNRSDTYTQKLAYVIYTDNKGVLRKETSWQGWRDKKITASDYDNIPTEGFVLNKGVGGARESYGWNSRNEYIRVYDPRGFEFEITVMNLLYILQECTATKGKGLEGEFVYSWQGKDLVLLPVHSQEYKTSTEFSSLQANKVSARDLKVGCSYLTKKMEDLIYIGRFMFYRTQYGRTYDYETVGKKGHIFYDENYENYGGTIKGKFMHLKTMNSLAKLNSDVEVSNYGEIMDKFNNSKHSTSALDFIVKPKPFKISRDLKKDNWGSKGYAYIQSADNRETYDYFHFQPEYKNWDEKEIIGYRATSQGTFKLVKNGLTFVCNTSDFLPKIKPINSRSSYYKYYKGEDIESLDFVDLKIKMVNNGIVDPKTFIELDR